MTFLNSKGMWITVIAPLEVKTVKVYVVKVHVCTDFYLMLKELNNQQYKHLLVFNRKITFYTFLQ